MKKRSYDHIDRLRAAAPGMAFENKDLFKLVSDVAVPGGQQMRLETDVDGKTLVDAFMAVMGNAPEVDDIVLLNACGKTSIATVSALMGKLAEVLESPIASHYLRTALAGFVSGYVRAMPRSLSLLPDADVPHEVAVHRAFSEIGAEFFRRTDARIEKLADAKINGRPIERDVVATMAPDIQVSKSGSVIVAVGKDNPLADSSNDTMHQISMAARDAARGRTKGQA